MEKLKTRTFKVNGIVVKVVTVMGFARIIGKSVSTVRRYEHEGTIPLCIFKIKGYRYYPVSLAEETAKIIKTFKGSERPPAEKVAQIHELFENERRKYAY